MPAHINRARWGCGSIGLSLRTSTCSATTAVHQVSAIRTRIAAGRLYTLSGKWCSPGTIVVSICTFTRPTTTRVMLVNRTGMPAPINRAWWSWNCGTIVGSLCTSTRSATTAVHHVSAIRTRIAAGRFHAMSVRHCSHGSIGVSLRTSTCSATTAVHHVSAIRTRIAAGRLYTLSGEWCSAVRLPTY